MSIVPEKKDRPELLPDRHPQADFFVADILDAAIKDDMASMEHPMFSLATKPDLRIREYTTAKGDSVRIRPGTTGLATIFDKDVLIYCVSQLIAALNRGERISRTLHIQAKDLLMATNRRTDGPAYARLIETMERLDGTRITTTIATGGTEQTTGFGLVESWDVIKKQRDGRMLSMSVTLSEWLFHAVLGKEVLTLHKDYFRLRKPTERRIYEIARKHTGRQPEFRIGLEALHTKCGSTAPLRKLRETVRKMIEAGHLPDFDVELTAGDVVIFRQREKWWAKDEAPALPGLGVFPYRLQTDTYEAAKKFTRQWGEDVYAWEQDWKDHWAENGRERLLSPDKAFLGFCKARSASKGQRGHSERG